MRFSKSEKTVETICCETKKQSEELMKIGKLEVIWDVGYESGKADHNFKKSMGSENKVGLMDNSKK